MERIGSRGESISDLGRRAIGNASMLGDDYYPVVLHTKKIPPEIKGIFEDKVLVVDDEQNDVDFERKLINKLHIIPSKD